MSIGMTIQLVVYGALLSSIMVYFYHRRLRKTQVALRTLIEEEKTGNSGPISLHPLIDVTRCIGCGACVNACPEERVLGLIDNKAALIRPAHCIGHGACKAACPADAITLVFGSEARGIDIPVVSPEFETNVPGLFIAGELGGMGLIRNAVEQGRQAMESIRRKRGRAEGDQLDVLVVGAGPAGFSASLAALQHKLRCATLEQESLGGTVAHFPRGKLVMTSPMDIPLIGKVRLTETDKETLLKLWQDIERKTGVRINYHERVDRIEPVANGFRVTSSRAIYQTRSVLLAIGRRGTPRKLEVPGEELSKVVYRLIDPAQYGGQHVLVVGGGDAALEAASSISEETDAKVTLSYRSESFSRAKEKNRRRLDDLVAKGRVQVMMKSSVKLIQPDRIFVEQEGKLLQLHNDAVIVCAGGVLPTAFLQQVGIMVETKYGTA
ncbi:MAG: NAD(P)-binding domain-containing protein [Gammaproteobacteria bacterium]|nr:NAD(P)-binding domain-containing protein [Gammaproteobacteria bacterium]